MRSGLVSAATLAFMVSVPDVAEATFVDLSAVSTIVMGDTLLDAAVTSITNVADLICGEDSIAPYATLKNNGNVPLTEVVIAYGVAGSTSHSSPWSGLLLPGETVNLFLPPIGVVTGENVLVVASSLPNGGVDMQPSNDGWSMTFTASVPVGLVNLILTLDDYGSDVTWQLTTEAGTALYEGGPYANNTNGVIDSVAFCLTTGCYTFMINDVFGNGLCCADGEGGYVIRDGYATVFAESDGQYADQNVSEFCLDAVGVAEVDALQMTVLPNPSTGRFLVKLDQPIGQAELRVVDALGREIHHMLWNGSTLPVIDLSNERDGVYHLLVSQGSGRVARRVVLAR